MKYRILTNGNRFRLQVYDFINPPAPTRGWRYVLFKETGEPFEGDNPVAFYMERNAVEWAESNLKNPEREEVWRII